MKTQSRFAVTAYALGSSGHASEIITGDIFTFIIKIIAYHKYNSICLCSSLLCRFHIRAVLIEHLYVRSHRSNTLQRCHDILRINTAGTMVTDILIISQLSEHRKLFHLLFIKREHSFIFNQSNRFLCSPLCQCNMLRAAYDRHIVLLMSPVKGKDRTDNAQRRLIHLALRHKSVFHCFYQILSEILCNAHFHVLSAVSCLHRILHAIDEVTHDKTVEIPFSFQNSAQQIFVVAALYLIVQIVGTHDGSCTGVDTVLEMRQKYLPLCSLVRIYAYLESGIFHLVESKMLHTGHDILILHASYQSGSHLTDGKGFFAVSLLAAAPSRIVGKVDADTGEQVASEGPGLFSDSMTDLFLQLRVKGCTSRHGYRETGRLAKAAYNPPGSITELHGRNHSFNSSRRIRRNIIMTVITAKAVQHFLKLIQINVGSHQIHFFFQGQTIHDLFRFLCQ